MTKIAVTGGAGFVGTNLVRSLLELEHQVVVVDDFSTGLQANLVKLDCEIHSTSLLDFTRLSKSIEGCDYIFHLAARGSVPRSIRNPRATYDVNFQGTLNVLECARATGATVAFSSSSSVYGSNQLLPKNESMWTAPLTPYASSKLSGESIVHSYANSYSIQSVTYRFFNIFGPWQRPDHDYAAVIPKWIWKIMNNEEIEIFGNGEQSRDFTYVDDVIKVLIDGMKRQLNHPSPINLAFGSRVNLNEVVSALGKNFGKIKVSYQKERVGDVKHSQNDPRLLQELFPSIKSIQFPEALEKTIEWFAEFGSSIANGPKLRD
jgi:UDP-glucose 4-epimerase